MLPRILIFLIVFLFSGQKAVWGSESNSGQVILEAMGDELDRTMSRLKLPGYPPPYFCQLNLYENDDFSVEATLGAATSKNRERQRTFDPIIRVGSYDFDNSNFYKPNGFSFTADTTYETLGPISDAPIGDDYHAIRKTFWINSDYNYKKAVEKLEQKKAYTLERNRELKLDDFSRARSIVFIKPTQNLKIDQELWTNRVKDLSRVFRNYPQIRNSWVRYDERIINTWLINSEGTKVQIAERAVRILSYANCQSQDGSVMTDGRVFLAHDRKNLPSMDVIAQELDELARSLIKRSKAEKIDYYEGPVLFEGKAAAQLFARVMAPYLIVHRKKLGMNYYNETDSRLSRRMGRRVMPLFLSVVDDPFAREFRGQPLFGGFDIDDEGVMPEKLVLIKDGYLKTLCSGRTPTKHVKTSNGHGSLQSSSGSAKFSVLFVKSKKTSSKKQLMKRLKELGKEARLDYVIVVRRLANSVRDGSLFETVDSQSIDLGAQEGQLTEPIDFYKVSLKTGKETLLRAGKFGPVTARILKDIVLAGDDSDAYPVEESSNSYCHLITPSILVSEVEIEKEENVSKPPLIPNPLSELNES